MNRPVRSVLIVGGGTAGWMAATYLATHLHAAGRSVTLVESKTIPIIGVGEATVPPLVGYLRLLGISEQEFMRRSHATFKLGVRFEGWHDGREDDRFWHPFGPVGGDIDGLPLFHYWLKSLQAGNAEGPYDSYSLQALLGEQEKAPRPIEGSSFIYDKGQYAYHLDAGAFAEFLKDEGVRRGTRHIVDEVTGVALDERGHIARVMTKEHGALSADLYVDCSGFKAMLAEGALGDGWVDWSDVLLCDRALAAPLPHKEERIAPFTRSTALSAGWMWRIALSHRVGNGYVHCSRYIKEEAARLEMARLLGEDPEKFDPRLIPMKVGRRKRFWLGNCVAVGLASGFVEPIESTGIFLIQRALSLLLTYFPDCAFEPQLAQRYNERMAATYEEIRDFIVAHYVLSRREDSEFWRDYRAIALPDSLGALLELYDRTGRVEPVQYAMFPSTSWYCILAGQRRLPQALHGTADLADFAKVRHILGLIRTSHARLAPTLPSHRAYLEALGRGQQRVVEPAPMPDLAATAGIG